MKQLFEKNDLKCGTFLIKNSAGNQLTDLSFASTVVFKIGFSYDSKLKYGLCSVLTDGFYVGIANSMDELTEYLNNEKGSGYRLLTKKELLSLIEANHLLTN